MSALRAFKKRPFSRKVRVAIRHHPELWRMYCVGDAQVAFVAEENFVSLLAPGEPRATWWVGEGWRHDPVAQIRNRLREFRQISPLEFLAECAR